FKGRKIREWTTFDWILNYTFRSPAPPANVSGYDKNGGSAPPNEKNIVPVSTAEYRPRGWRSWFNKNTITFGIKNVRDEEPPFVAASIENGYDESTANIRGRTWYVALRKRF